MTKYLILAFFTSTFLFGQTKIDSNKTKKAGIISEFKQGYKEAKKNGEVLIGDSIIKMSDFGAKGLLINEKWKFKIDNNQDYSKITFDDSKWETKNIDANIYEYGLAKKSESTWFRKTIYIDSAIVNKPLLFKFETSARAEVYLDGEKIIESEKTGKKIIKYRFHEYGIPYPIFFRNAGNHSLAIKYTFPNISFPKNKLDVYPMSIRLHTPNAYANLNVSKFGIERLSSGIFIGFFFMMAFIHFFFHYFFRNQRFNLYFCISLAIFGLHFYLKNINDSYYNINYQMASRLFEKTLFFSGHAVLLYAICMFLSFKNKKIYWLISLSSLIILLLYWFGFASEIYRFIPFFLFVALYSFMIWNGAKNKNNNAQLLKKAVAIFLITLFSLFLLMIVYYIIFAIDNEFGINVWLPIIGVIALVGPQIAFSGAVSFGLAKDYISTNNMLNQKLAEVESLSKEKESILEQQNTLLEQTVTNRTEQLSKSINELKAAQNLLVQSEKLAALGELTAGIAHEIQNPLNFVNNFSEVNKELIGELKVEIDNGNYQDAKEIADNIQSNQEKIDHHGKRAASIVKGMLQHSRNSNGQKEPTDINALADEYLRLAYHGLRAKDKSFNASMDTSFDPNIGEIHINGQDVGRVILNLVTNAFHTVRQRAITENKNNTSYKPTVSISTKKANNQVIIAVKDNGSGIEKQNLEKIFQPFFTTKAPGEGTGLGLSLAYDIITKGHNGKIDVNSEMGMGTEFILTIPID
jgi:two-component system, NtrC family, sensor kinase